MTFRVVIHGDELARFTEMMSARGDRNMVRFLRPLALESLERWESGREQAGAVTAAD